MPYNLEERQIEYASGFPVYSNKEKRGHGEIAFDHKFSKSMLTWS